MAPKSELRFNSKDHDPIQKILEIYPIYKLGASYIYIYINWVCDKKSCNKCLEILEWLLEKNIFKTKNLL